MPQLEWNRNAGTRVREHSGSRALTNYSRRRYAAKYSIEAPYVFDKTIRLSKATHGPMHVSNAQLNEMMSCTVAARAVKPDAPARMKQEHRSDRTTSMCIYWFPSTHRLQPSAAHSKVQHPSTVCIRQDRPFVESKTRTDADHHRR